MGGVSSRPLFALSTMYWQHKGWSLQAFWEIAQSLGCEGIEISHIVREEDVQDLRPDEVPIVAVHAPAPKRDGPAGWDAMRLISTPDESARQWAVAQVEHSIRWAARMGAPVVCVHLGVVEHVAREVWVLEQRYLAGQRGQPVYEAHRSRVEAIRRRWAAPYLEAARRSLDTLAACAAREGVRLGLESRRYFHEIPTLAELEYLLANSDPAVVGFWYDVGHCQVLSNLGMIPHDAWWHRVPDRLVGVHVHDVIGLRDHLVPGTGDVPWHQAATFMATATVITFEVDWYFTEEEVRRGVTFLRKHLREHGRIHGK